jgi:hypothetical protein
MGLTTKRVKTVRRIAIGVLVVGITVVVSWGGYVDYSYSVSMPRQPQTQTGRIYPLSVDHGTIVYVTQQELAYDAFVSRVEISLGAFLIVSLASVKLCWK